MFSSGLDQGKLIEARLSERGQVEEGEGSMVSARRIGALLLSTTSPGIGCAAGVDGCGGARLKTAPEWPS